MDMVIWRAGGGCVADATVRAEKNTVNSLRGSQLSACTGAATRTVTHQACDAAREMPAQIHTRFTHRHSELVLGLLQPGRYDWDGQVGLLHRTHMVATSCIFIREYLDMKRAPEAVPKHP